MKLTLLLQLAGVLHLGLLGAGATFPRVIGLPAHLAPLPPFIRRLFWVYYAYVAAMLLTFGTFTLLFARQMAAGEPFALAVCAYLALFWIGRLVIGLFVLDEKPYLTHWLFRLGFYALNATFLYLATIYVATACHGYFPQP